jgi:hypothetical protein
VADRPLDAQTQQRLMSDPVIAQIIAEEKAAGPQSTLRNRFMGGMRPGAIDKIKARAAELGVQAPSGMSLQFDINRGFGFNDDFTAGEALRDFGLMAGATVAGGAALGAPVLGFGGAAAGGGAAGGGYTANAVNATASAATGGAGAAGMAGIPSWLQRALGMGSEALGAISEQRAANRAGEIDYDTIRDAAEQRRHSGMLDALRADLDQRRFLSDEYGRNTGRAIHGGLLQGTQDVDIQAPAGVQMGTVSGGLRPSSITGKEDIGRTLQQRAMQELTNPTQPGGVGPDGPTPGRLPNIPNAPDLSPRRERSGLDTGIDLAGLASSIFADIYRVPGATKTAPIPPPPAPAPANTRTPGLLGQNYWNQVRF